MISEGLVPERCQHISLEVNNPWALHFAAKRSCVQVCKRSMDTAPASVFRSERSLSFDIQAIFGCILVGVVSVHVYLFSFRFRRKGLRTFASAGFSFSLRSTEVFCFEDIHGRHSLTPSLAVEIASNALLVALQAKC